MATRYYLSSSGAPAVSPLFDAGWGSTGSASSLQLIKATKSNTALSGISVSTASGVRALFSQFVSNQIGVFNFSGKTFSLVVGTRNGHVDPPNINLSVGVRLYHSDGSFTTLLSLSEYDSAFSGGDKFVITKIMNSVALPAITSQNGDRIVVEIGAKDSDSISHAPIEYFGDPTATSDYALSSGHSSSNPGDGDPWCEFSGSIPNAATPISINASLSFVGNLLTKPSHLYFTAALNFVGLMAGRSAHLGLSPATLSFAGGFTKGLRRVLSGVFGSSGTSNRFISSKRTATLSFSGSPFKPIRNLLLQATLSFSGALKRFVSSIRSSVLQFAADIKLGKPGGGIFYFATFLARLSSSATIPKLIQSGQSANLGLSSSGKNVIASNQKASFSPTATLNNFINLGRAAMTSVLGLPGNLTKLKGKFFSATLSFVQPLKRLIMSTQPATLSFIPTLPKFTVTDVFNAILSFIGMRVDSMQLLVQGATVMRITATGGMVMRVTAKYNPNVNAADIP